LENSKLNIKQRIDVKTRPCTPEASQTRLEARSATTLHNALSIGGGVTNGGRHMPPSDQEDPIEQGERGPGRGINPYTGVM